MELDINHELVCDIIFKAREFQTQESLSTTEEPRDPHEELSWQKLDAYNSELTYTEVKSAIEKLEPDQQITLVALMWLGRGDYSLDEWPQVVTTATDQRTGHTAEYLLATPLLADYLADGLEQFGHAC